MCERCEANRDRNTAIKRGATDALFGEPEAGTRAERALSEVPGFSAFLEIGRRIEALSRLTDRAAYEAACQEATAVISAMTAAGRTDALKVAHYMMVMAEGIYKNLVVAKTSLQDPDSDTVTILRENDEIVVRLNGEVIQRLPIRPDAKASEVEDAAERAMQAHREHYQS